jgi:spore coat polysaccharide biosynthesis predicted glycosyltransferase SpsG
MSKKKVLFLPSLGPNLGMGNFVRCCTIAREIRESVKVVFSHREMPTAQDNLKKEGFLFAPEGHIFENLHDIDMVFIDQQGPVNCQPLFRRIKCSAPHALITALDYFYRDHSELDVMINLIDYHLSEWPGSSIHCDYHEGLNYAITRPSFRPLRNPTGLIVEPVKNVLITFGTEDPLNWTVKAVKWLETYIQEKLNVRIVMGLMNNNRAEIMEMLKSDVRHRYTLIDHVPNIELYMSEADVIFSGCGTTLMELAFLGKPVIATPQHEIERIFLGHFEKSGYTVTGSEHCLRELKPEPAVSVFRDKQLRSRMSLAGMSLVDGKGATRIAKIILGKLNSTAVFEE